MNMGKKGKRRIITEEDKAVMRRLREEGRTYSEISEVVGVSIDSVRHYTASVKSVQSIRRTEVTELTALTARPAWFEEDIASMMSVRKLF